MMMVVPVAASYAFNIILIFLGFLSIFMYLKDDIKGDVQTDQ